MKKIISVFLTFIFLLTCVVIPASANEITSSTTGFTNIHFSNGYIGFCIDQKKSGSVSGDTFTPAASTSVADNNVDGSDISQYLKVMFTQGFNTLFTPDGNGSYHITDSTAASILEFAIYHFTGEQSYIWGDIKTLVNMVKAYEGPDIPDDGYSLSIANGDIVTFSFMVLEPQKEGQQSFFAYKLNVSQEATHEHDYSDDWKSDDKEHWHECECEDKTDIDEHSGNTADCVTPSKCTVCGKELAGVNSENHTGNTEIRNEKPASEFEDGYTGDVHCKDCGVLLEKGKTIPATHEHDYSDDWKSDDKEHWHECECEDKTDVDEHTYTDGVCSVCGKELSTDDPNGDDPNGDDPDGDDPDGDDPNGDDPNGDDPNGDDPNGDDPDGDDPDGDDPNGDDPNGDDPNGDDPNGDDPNGDDNEDIIDIIIGLLGDMDFNVDTDEIKEALEEALAGLDINVSIDEITEYISNLDSKADIDKVISDIIDIIIGSDDNKPEGTPETDSDTESESDDGNTNSDTISPDTGVHNGVAVMIIILSLGIIAAFAAIICKKKHASA